MCSAHTCRPVHTGQMPIGYQADYAHSDTRSCKVHPGTCLTCSPRLQTASNPPPCAAATQPASHHPYRKHPCGEAVACASLLVDFMRKTPALWCPCLWAGASPPPQAAALAPSRAPTVPAPAPAPSNTPAAATAPHPLDHHQLPVHLLHCHRSVRVIARVLRSTGTAAAAALRVPHPCVLGHIALAETVTCAPLPAPAAGGTLLAVGNILAPCRDAKSQNRRVRVVAYCRRQRLPS